MKAQVLYLFFAAILVLARGVLANSAPEIRNVTAFQRTDGLRLVDIRYDLVDADADHCMVVVEVSNDGGATWTVQAISLRGALGAGIQPGTGKQIIWDAGKDLPGAYGSNYKVRITADDGNQPDEDLTPGPPDMVFIPEGDFRMGDHFKEREWDFGGDELPIHRVNLDSFWMSTCEITNQHYCDYLNSALSQDLIEVRSGVVFARGGDDPYFDTHGAISKSEGYWSQITYVEGSFVLKELEGQHRGDHPLVYVSWFGAAAYCNWLSQQEGLHVCYDLVTWNCDFANNGYRLPTEAEWEYAARGGLKGQRFSWGNTIAHNQANYRSTDSQPYDVSSTRGYHPVYIDESQPYTSPVGLFPPNGYGLFDMTGNAGEWCNDYYDWYYYERSPKNNPRGPGSAKSRVSRGGNWAHDAFQCRVTTRIGNRPDHRNSLGGFRVVRR